MERNFPLIMTDYQIALKFKVRQSKSTDEHWKAEELVSRGQGRIEPAVTFRHSRAHSQSTPQSVAYL